MLISPHTKMYAIAVILAVLSWDSRADVIIDPAAVAPAAVVAFSSQR